MEIKAFFIYLLIMAGSTFLIRALPFTLMRNKIKNPFINSFLYYIPYTVLAAMTFPSALYATGHMISAATGLAASILVSLKTKSLTIVAVAACVAVFAAECILMIVSYI